MPLPKRDQSTQEAQRGMPAWTLALRCLSLLTLALWVGGFTFYSAIVIPALHDAMGSVETGFVTQRVTDTLNLIGLAAVLVCWSWVYLDRDSIRFRRARIGLLGVSTALLLFLIVLYRLMDQRLESGGLQGFYPLHRIYLLASTAQWLANIGLLLLFALSPAILPPNPFSSQKTGP